MPIPLIRPIPLLVAWATAAAMGCAKPGPIASPIDVSSLAFSESGADTMDARWWTVFEDPALDAAIAEGLSDNFTVRAAWARLEAAEAVVRRARAPWFPSLTATTDVAIRSDRPVVDGDTGPVTVGLAASWEIDLWGRIRAQVLGESAAREIVREDAHTAALSLSAQIADAWIAIGAAREELALLDEQLHANTGMAEVVEARFLNGVVRQADALRQQRLLEQTRAQQVARLEDLEVLEHQLAVLLGRPPTLAIDPIPTALPDAPPLPDAGLPAELVRRRPDVRAAEQAVRRADAGVAEAVADQFPRLTLGGAISNAPASPQALVSGWIGSFVANLLAPIFEGGRRKAEVRRARAEAEAILHEYGDAVLVAMQEVEDALARNRRQAQILANLDTQVDLATRTAEGLEAQYVGGLSVSYLDVLTAQTTAQQLRRQHIDARARLLTLRVDLYRALAGALPADPAPEETP